MEDLIIIILTLIIAGAGAIGQMKKKKHASAVSSGPQSSEDVWELFKNETLLPNLKTEYESHGFEEREESVPYENEQDYKFEPTNEGGVLISGEAKAQSVESNIITEKRNKFPLRKAVVYSEILNRKYI